MFSLFIISNYIFELQMEQHELKPVTYHLTNLSTIKNRA